MINLNQGRSNVMAHADPERLRTCQQEYKRRKKSGKGPMTGALPPHLTAFRLEGARNVLALLQDEVNAVRSDPNVGTLERARVICNLARVTLRAMEFGILAARVENLERILDPEGDPVWKGCSVSPSADPRVFHNDPIQDLPTEASHGEQNQATTLQPATENQPAPNEAPVASPAEPPTDGAVVKPLKEEKEATPVVRTEARGGPESKESQETQATVPQPVGECRPPATDRSFSPPPGLPLDKRLEWIRQEIKRRAEERWANESGRQKSQEAVPREARTGPDSATGQT
jgi:hypothetical protein